MLRSLSRLILQEGGIQSAGETSVSVLTIDRNQKKSRRKYSKGVLQRTTIAPLATQLCLRRKLFDGWSYLEMLRFIHTAKCISIIVI